MESLRDFAGRLDEAAETLDSAAHEVARVGPVDSAVGADGPGRLGELGLALHTQWVASAETRAREATALAARLAETAATLHAVASAYADTDDTARRRQPGEEVDQRRVAFDGSWPG